MSTHIPYASLRHQTWVYRRTYPKALQAKLGTALKQSLKTSDARVAKARVEELNVTFARIISEAEAHVPTLATAGEAPRLGVARPRYQRLCLLGDKPVAELVKAYLGQEAKRLRPGSYKSVRFAMELLTSHLGTVAVAAVSERQGREVLGHLARLSPNIRKYAVARGEPLARLAKLSQELERVSLTPQTQTRIWEQMLAFLDWAAAAGELAANPWGRLRVSLSPAPEPHKVLTDRRTG